MAKGLKHRLLWTWDHSMDWAPRPRSIQEYGCSDPYYKRPEDFVEDYSRLTAYLGRLGFTGVIVYGFLRDCHGGIDAAKEICRRAREHGMCVVPGIGVNSYGGVYWEGNHEFNLSHWLDRHPGLEAVGTRPHSRYLRMACPSKKENLEWHKDAVRWLCETFDIGGINYETGDYGLCQCEPCQKRSSRAASWAFRDMAELLPPLMDAAEKARPGILPICECYFDNVHDPGPLAPLNVLPHNAILQFCINRWYLERFLKEMTPEKAAQLPPRQKVIRTHIGSQWNDQRHGFVARDLARLATKVAEIGMDGVTVFAEVSPARTVHELNYLALASFLENPELAWDEFVAQRLAPILGGEELARTYVELLGGEEADPAALESAKSILKTIGEPAWRRWLWLCERLCDRIEAGKKERN